MNWTLTNQSNHAEFLNNQEQNQRTRALARWCFPALGAGSVHVFPLLAPPACFPRLVLGECFVSTSDWFITPYTFYYDWRGSSLLI